MRQEIGLVLILVVLILLELFTLPEKKKNIIPVAIVLFGIHLISGFLPVQKGSLFGGMYRTDEITILVKNILNLGVFIILMQGAKWLNKPQQKNKIAEYLILMLSTLTGMYFMVSAGDFLMLYIGIELATIPVAAMAAYERFNEKSAEAGIKLILISAFSSGITLFGISMIYGTTGSVYFSEVVKTFGNSSLQTLALIFFLSGMAFKISVVPFHLWTADVYEGAPVNVTSYLSVISKGAAAFILTVVLFKVFPQVVRLWDDVIYVLSVLTMTIGNLFALRQKNIKRFLAFSSIAQAGFILLGIVGASQLGMTTIVYFILVYIFSNLGAFGVVSIISDHAGKESIDDYNGLYKTNPLLSLTMMLAMFSLAGIPPVAGFFGKFFLFMAAAQKGYYILVLLAVLNTIISLYYYLLIVKAMFINKNETPIARIKTDFAAKLALILCVAGIFIIGFASSIYEYIFSISFGI